MARKADSQQGPSFFDDPAAGTPPDAPEQAAAVSSSDAPAQAASAPSPSLPQESPPPSTGKAQLTPPPPAGEAGRGPLLLVMDGHAMVFRAWFALQNARPLTIRTTGEDVRGVYSFTTTFFKTLADHRPTHAVIAFDPPGPTFRHEQYPEYKANRPEIPRELTPERRAREAGDDRLPRPRSRNRRLRGRRRSWSDFGVGRRARR